MEDIKHKLNSCVSSILLNLKYQDEIDDLTDEFVLRYLQPLLDEDQATFEVKDSLIISTIKEYLYHLLNEVGGVKGLKQHSVILLMGSDDQPVGKICIHLTKPPPNELNVLVGV